MPYVINYGFAISNGHERVHFRGFACTIWATYTFNKGCPDEFREDLVDYYKKIGEDSGMIFDKSVTVYEFTGTERDNLKYELLCGRVYP